MGATPAVELVGVSKRYGPVDALKPTSLVVDAGAYYVLLGPSGGGKTTTLRLIGGLARPSGGRVLLDGQDVTALPANKRNTSMVFQSYALFPHMNVAQNVAYGLKLRKLDRAEVHDRVQSMLQLVGLRGFDARMPHELSGGQQQRVQLARSLVLETAILLLDEPLAALDAKLRKSMCLELKHIQERVGITFLHVTHNQEEAMTIADRIAVIAHGELVEHGTAREIYERPRRRFTADFIGESTLLEGTVESVQEDFVLVDVGCASVRTPARGHTVAVGQAVCVSVRSELARIEREGPAVGGVESVPATFVEQVYVGFSVSALVRLANGEEAASRTLAGGARESWSAGEQVRFSWATGDGRLHVG
ncbi:MAG: ABC transporter ATP-binding protein [Gammaproteobacteria bacterium]